MVYKPGFKTMISQIYSADDEHLDSDVQFGVTRALIGDYRRYDGPSERFAAPWYSLDQRFLLEPGEARRPTGTDTCHSGGVNWIRRNASSKMDRSRLPLIYVNGAFCSGWPYAGNKAA